MGAPWFQIRHMEDSDGLVALSANFTLYGDMSDRMMSLAAGLGPTQEIYSIDESFIGLQDVRDLTDLKVEKTPTFFVNGRPLSSFGHKQLADLVEQEVSKTKK